MGCYCFGISVLSFGLLHDEDTNMDTIMEKIQASEFLDETSQVLDDLESDLEHLKGHGDDSYTLARIHFLWHEVKSFASLFGLFEIADLSFVIEEYVGKAIDEELSLDAALIEKFAECLAWIRMVCEKQIYGQQFDSIEFEKFCLAFKKLVAHHHTKNSTEIRSLKKTQDQSRNLKSVPKQARRVLIVEDNDVNLKLLEEMVRSSDSAIEIVVVDNASEGIYHALTGSFSLVFLDIMMSVIDGYDFLTIISRNGKSGNMKDMPNIVVQTAIQSYAQLANLARKEIVQEIIKKPITMARVKECLLRYCQ